MSSTDQKHLHKPPDLVDRAHWWIFLLLQCFLLTGMILAVIEKHWIDVLLIGAIILVLFIPTALGHRFQVRIPTEFHLMAVIFLFASLFLGEIRDYYTRFWWWDLALHTTSGLLLGILGFLLVYVLNEDDKVDFHMLPRFMALFAFMFAVACGALWEIFEFAMDQIAGTNMQKPMFGDPSGLADTMWDLIVDSVGALVISLFGWWYMKIGKRSFVDLWIEKFIRQNPRLFNTK
jgi:hypothetical protein